MMRISDQTATNNAIQYMNANKERLTALQNLVASGKQFQSASDNPARASASLTLRSSLQTGQNYLNNAGEINAWMETTDLAVSQLTDLITKATTAVTKGLTDTIGADERRTALAPEVDMLLENAISVANTSHMGKYIFSGYQINTKPYEVSSVDPNTIEYHGDTGIMQHDLGPGQTISTNVNASSTLSVLFNALVKARNALLNNDRSELDSSLSELKESTDLVTEIRATNGARMRQVDAAIDHLGKTNLTLKSLLSEREDVNMAEAIAMMQGQETTYQAVLEVGQRAISALNLFDVLQ
jgi:flagellar hook-associated protein 3 FlgL